VIRVQNPGVPARPDAGIEWIENAPLDGLNSMGLRARARLLATVTSEEGLIRFLEWAKEAGQEFVVLGGGTNIIFGDQMLDRVILRLGGEFSEFVVEGNQITAGAAVPLARLVEEARKSGLAGLEYAWHIPGSLGGALVGNAGIPGWEIGDAVEWVEVFDRGGQKCRFAASEITFRYRRSSLGDHIIVRACLALTVDNPERIADRLEQTKALRKRQPRGARSAGCIFKNPRDDAAGRLIDAAGLKGLRRGGAVVSTDHGNFIINEGNATGRDVIALIAEIRRRVFEQFHVKLETEVHILRSTK
jgi:UDP-N-acetylmuramate dehydrogenase